MFADNAGVNQMTGTGKDAAKLDRETEETHRMLFGPAQRCVFGDNVRECHTFLPCRRKSSQ